MTSTNPDVVIVGAGLTGLTMGFLPQESRS